MKKYNKPTLNVENYELDNVIAALSTAPTNTLHDIIDVYDWNDFWANE